MLEVKTIDTQNVGPKVLFLGAVHGNEQAGTKAINRFLEELESAKLQFLKGSLTFIPICNPKAYEQNLRFVEENLNRVVRENQKPTSYEQKLGNELAKHIKQTDFLIDLHSTHCQEDAPFVFCDVPSEQNQKIIKNLPIDYIVQGWPDVYKNSPIADYSTENCANFFGKTGITVECGYHFGTMGETIAYNVIINTLIALEILAGKAQENTKQIKICMDCFVIKTKNGKLSKNYQHLDFVSKGEVLAAYDDGEKISASKDGYILIPNHNAEINTEWFYLGYKIG